MEPFASTCFKPHAWQEFDCSSYFLPNSAQQKGAYTCFSVKSIRESLLPKDSGRRRRLLREISNPLLLVKLEVVLRGYPG